MTATEYARSILIFGLMLGQPILWAVVKLDPPINWTSPTALTVLALSFVGIGLTGTHAWLAWKLHKLQLSS